MFFMDYDSFMKNFRIVDIAQINDNASYVYKTLTDKKIEGVYFQVGIKNKGVYHFQINKTPLKTMFCRTEERKYQQQMTSVRFMKLNIESE